jgi:hypothetical protein
MTNNAKAISSLAVAAAAIIWVSSSSSSHPTQSYSAPKPVRTPANIAPVPGAKKLCNAYFVLVNQNWNDDSIYQNLKDAGVTNNRDDFNAFVQYCYNH